MKKIEEFKSMVELLQYKKELETRISDEDTFDEVLDNIWSELLNVNELVNDINSVKQTNKMWLATILMLLNSRNKDNNYGIKVVNDSNKQKKIYRLDNSLNRATIEEYNIDKEYNTIEIVDKFGLAFTYDNFYGEFCLEEYLERKKEFSDIIKLYGTSLFTEKEINVLNKYVFDKYNENIKKNKVKVRK